MKLTLAYLNGLLALESEGSAPYVSAPSRRAPISIAPAPQLP